MYFVRYQPLKGKLRERSLTDREALPYLVLDVFFITVISLIYTMREYNEFDMVAGVLSIIFGLGGVLYAYKQNGGKDGFDLIQKYIVLGWVVFVRWFLIAVPFWIVTFLFDAMFGITETEGPHVLVFAFLELVFYQRLGIHIRDTRNITYEQGASGDNQPS